MKVILAMMFIFLVSGVLGTLLVTEKSDLKYMGERSFKKIVSLLDSKFPNIKTNTLMLLEPKITGFTTTTEPSIKFDGEKNMVQIDMHGKAFSFELSFLWIYNFIALTTSGQAKTSISINDISFQVTYGKTSLTPELKEFSWKVDNLIITDNVLAQKLGIDSRISQILLTQFNTKLSDHVKTTLLPIIKDYLMLAYPEKRDIILPYYDNEHSVKIHYNLNQITVAESTVKSQYEKVNSIESNLIKVTEENLAKSDEDYAATIKFPKEIIEITFNDLFGKIRTEFTIEGNKVPNSSLFKLTTRQFAQVVPDLYMRVGERYIDVKVNSKSNKFDVTFNKDNTITIKGLKFLLTFIHGQQNLLEAVIDITGIFSPALMIKEGELSGILDLNIQSLEIANLDSLTCSYKPCYKEGLKSFLMSGLENWIKVSYSKNVLGSGIYLEYIGKLDSSRSKASVVNDEIEVMLFTTH